MAARELGWNRELIRKGLHELQSVTLTILFSYVTKNKEIILIFSIRKLFLSFFLLLLPGISWSANYGRSPNQGSPDQVLVIYNADWDKDSEGTEEGQDAKEVANYYVRMHTDPITGKKPYLLGLSSKYRLEKHLNDWKIDEKSHDNKNGLIFTGQGAEPENPEWVRDSRKVEITVPGNDTDWNSLVIRCRSDISGEEKTLYQNGKKEGSGEIWVSGPPQGDFRNRTYPSFEKGKGRCFRFDASRIFPGTVTVFLTVKNLEGKTLKDLQLKYFDYRDFEFSTTGPDGISDEDNLEEDVLQPVKEFLESPANALPDGTPLKNHILYIVLTYGMPYSANDVFGIAHGATSNPGDHGVLSSLEERLQTLYYGWDTHFRPPVISMFMSGGPDAKEGVGNHIITTALRLQLTGSRWNPYAHPDTYSFLGGNNKRPPDFFPIAPLQERRKYSPDYFFVYGVTRVDGTDTEEAKRIIDYSVYASRYLRPEIDCNVRERLRKETHQDYLQDIPARLTKAEKENLWGKDELKALGFAVYSETGQDGLPFLVQSAGRGTQACVPDPKWSEVGFYPGGMGRKVISDNGWNLKNAAIRQYLARGVTVSACGAPAYGGGPHITNATFWDNRILMRYLFRGMDLGEAFLLSTFYVNWSTSLIGDPLLHPDIGKTIIDHSPPHILPEAIAMEKDHDNESYRAIFSTSLEYDPEHPELARMMVRCKDSKNQMFQAVSSLYSRRPKAYLTGLPPKNSYSCEIVLEDPYGNVSEPVHMALETDKITLAGKLWRGTLNIIKDIHRVDKQHSSSR